MLTLRDNEQSFDSRLIAERQPGAHTNRSAPRWEKCECLCMFVHMHGQHLVTVCPAHTAAIFSSCLFRQLYTFSLVLSTLNTCWLGWRPNWQSQSRAFSCLPPLNVLSSLVCTLRIVVVLYFTGSGACLVDLSHRKVHSSTFNIGQPSSYPISLKS